MSPNEYDIESSLPLELKLRVLEAELEQVESDCRTLARRKKEIETEIDQFQKRLTQLRRRRVLRRVK